jgi:hypothetical protein
MPQTFQVRIAAAFVPWNLNLTGIENMAFLISASLVPLPFLALQYMPGKVVGTRPLCATLLYLMGSGVCTLLMEGPLDIGDAFEGDMLISALRRPHTCETGGNVAYFCLLCPTKLR